MKVVMTSPSLKESDNVSGISSVVRGVIDASFSISDLTIIPVVVGKKDNSSRGVRWLIEQPLMLLRFVFAIAVARPEVVHVNGPLNSFAIYRDLFLLCFSRFFGRRAVYHLHGGDYVHLAPKGAVTRWAVRCSLRIANRVVVLGELEKFSLARVYGVSDEIICVLPNSVLTRDSYELTGKELSLSDDLESLKVLFLGRLIDDKGVKVLGEALIKLRSVGSVTAVFHGAGSLESYLKDYLLYELKDCALYGGVVSGAGKESAFRESDVLVLPSLKGEGLPMAILEAMAAGLPVIATSDGSITDAVKDGENGFIVDKGDVDSLARALLNAAEFKKTGRLKEMSKRSYDFVRVNFGMRAYMAGLLDIYGDRSALR